MKRRRSRARPLPGDEDEEEEEEEEEENTSDRRDSLRKRKRVNYWTDAHVDGEDEEEDDDEDDDEEDEDEEEEGELENNQFPVTCGTIRGTMDPEKLHRGEPCIEFQGDFFTPPEFEDIAGKSRAKKWKMSIFYKKNPLQYYFDKELLSTVGYLRRRRETAKQTTPSGSEFSEEESSTSKNDGENTVMLIESSEDEPENDRKVRVLAERKEEEVRNREMKDEEVTVVHVDNDEECIQSIATAVYKKVAKKMQVKVALERIQLQVVGPAEESRSDDQTGSMELPQPECLCEDEDEHSDEEDEQNPDPLSTAHVPGPSASPLNVQTEDPGETDVLSSGLDAAQQHGIKLETSSPQTPKASDHLQEEPALHAGPYILQTSTIKTSDDLQEEPALHAGPYILHTSTIKTSDYSPVKPSLHASDLQEEPAVNAGPYILQTSTIKASDDLQEEPTNHRPSGPLSDEDTLDIDQLKREKLKLQLKVLKLQEEYYTLRIRKLKE